MPKSTRPNGTPNSAKTAARERMAATGENYTTALRIVTTVHEALAPGADGIAPWDSLDTGEPDVAPPALEIDYHPAQDALDHRAAIRVALAEILAKRNEDLDVFSAWEVLQGWVPADSATEALFQGYVFLHDENQQPLSRKYRVMFLAGAGGERAVMDLVLQVVQYSYATTGFDGQVHNAVRLIAGGADNIASIDLADVLLIRNCSQDLPLDSYS